MPGATITENGEVTMTNSEVFIGSVMTVQILVPYPSGGNKTIAEKSVRIVGPEENN